MAKVTQILNILADIIYPKKYSSDIEPQKEQFLLFDFLETMTILRKILTTIEVLKLSSKLSQAAELPVNPQKNETILDLACGTAGFLISSYRHCPIMVTNSTKRHLHNCSWEAVRDQKVTLYIQKIQDRIYKVWGEGVEPVKPSIDKIMEQIELGVFVHPQNDRWLDFFKLLKSKLPDDVEVPNSLILGGSDANDFSKSQRLKEYLKIAEQKGLLGDALEYLFKISENHWIKSDGNFDLNEFDYWQLDELYRKETEKKWFFKIVENMQMNLAMIDTNKDGRILFVTETGWFFNEITCSDFETAKRKLSQNGFKRCKDCCFHDVRGFQLQQKTLHINRIRWVEFL